MLRGPIADLDQVENLNSQAYRDQPPCKIEMHDGDHRPITQPDYDFVRSEVERLTSRRVVFTFFDANDDEYYGVVDHDSRQALGFTNAQHDFLRGDELFSVVHLNTLLLQSLMTLKRDTPANRAERYIIQLSVASTVSWSSKCLYFPACFTDSQSILACARVDGRRLTTPTCKDHRGVLRG